jgi:hypothetical protein
MVVNRAFESSTVTRFWNPLSAAGRAALGAVIRRQAQIIAYIDDYKLLISRRSSRPLVIVFKKASHEGSRFTLPSTSPATRLNGKSPNRTGVGG